MAALAKNVVATKVGPSESLDQAILTPQARSQRRSFLCNPTTARVMRPGRVEENAARDTGSSAIQVSARESLETTLNLPARVERTFSYN